MGKTNALRKLAINEQLYMYNKHIVSLGSTLVSSDAGGTWNSVFSDCHLTETWMSLHLTLVIRPGDLVVILELCHILTRWDTVELLLHTLCHWVGLDLAVVEVANGIVTTNSCMEGHEGGKDVYSAGELVCLEVVLLVGLDSLLGRCNDISTGCFIESWLGWLLFEVFSAVLLFYHQT